MRRASSRVILMAGLSLFAQPLFAHGLLMKLDGRDNRIEGRLYYSNGTHAGREWVEISDHAGPPTPDTIQTGPDGRFTYTGRQGHRYLVRAIGEEGHEISMDITLAEQTRGHMIESPAEKAMAQDGGLPAWAVIGGLLALSAIPALMLRKRKG